MKLTLHKYVFGEMWPTFLASLFVFGLVMVATKMLSVTEWVVNQGVHPGQIIELVFYLLPNIILIALPAASLMAVLIAFIRLSGHNEIIAINSSGISLYQMLPPVLVLSFISFLMASLIAVFGVPWGNRSFKDLIFEVIESKTDLGIKERVFLDLFGDVVFYINSVSTKERIMKDIFVVDRRDKSFTNTIVAKEGRILKHPKSRMITLHFKDGTIFMVAKEFDSARTVRFNTYDLNVGLNDFMHSLASRKRSHKEMFIQELVHNINTTPKKGVKRNEMIIELLERFAIPLSVFFMGLIGVPLGAQLRSRIRSFGVVLSLTIFLIYYMFFIGVRSLCETGTINPYIGMWIPDLFLLGCCIYLYRRVASEGSFNILERLSFRHWFMQAERHGGGHKREKMEGIGFEKMSAGPRSNQRQDKLNLETKIHVQKTAQSDAEGYIVNRRHNKFHRLDCKWATKISPRNTLLLGSKQEALKQNYIPCRACKP